MTQKRMKQIEDAFNSDTEKMDAGKLEAASHAVLLMKEGIKTTDYVTLQLAAEGFAAVDATAFAATITALNNAVHVLNR